MSVKLMAMVWELDINHSDQSILLALADHGRDDGSKCFPQVDLIAWKTGYSRRQVQRILRHLEATELVTPVAFESGGRNNPTEYQINIEKGVKKSPFKRVDKYVDNRAKRVTSETPSEMERATFETQKGDIAMSQKGDIAMSPEPSLTINNRYKEEEPPAASFVLPDWIKKESWDAFEEMRKKERHPLTQRARELIQKELGKIMALGHDPNAALDRSTMCGYRGVKASWYERNDGQTKTEREAESRRQKMFAMANRGLG